MIRVYRDGNLWVIVETRVHAHQYVRIGTGETRQEAIESLQETPIESAGRDNGIASALRWARNEGWVSDPDELERDVDSESVVCTEDEVRV